MTAVLGCIADDFTGGTDLAETLSRNGMRTIQLLGVPDTALASEAAAQADALVVALKIRTVPVEEAVSQALAALEALRAAGCPPVLLEILLHLRLHPQGQHRPGGGGPAPSPRRRPRGRLPLLSRKQADGLSGLPFRGRQAAARNLHAQPPADAHDRREPHPAHGRAVFAQKRAGSAGNRPGRRRSRQSPYG